MSKLGWSMRILELFMLEPLACSPVTPGPPKLAHPTSDADLLPRWFGRHQYHSQLLLAVWCYGGSSCPSFALSLIISLREDVSKKPRLGELLLSACLILSDSCELELLECNKISGPWPLASKLHPGFISFT